MLLHIFQTLRELNNDERDMKFNKIEEVVPSHSQRHM